MINSMTDLTNAVTAMPIGIRTVNVKRMSIGEIWTLAEAGVRDVKFQEAAQLATSMRLTSDEKIKFMRNIMADMPKGAALQEAAQNWLGTPNGIAAVLTASIKKCDMTLKDADIAETLKQGSPQQVIDLASWCIGADAEKETDIPKVETPKQ